MSSRPLPVVNVWATTLEQSFEAIRSHAERYKFVAMDTEFPGVVVRPVGTFASGAAFNYQVRPRLRGARAVCLGAVWGLPEA